LSFSIQSNLTQVPGPHKIFKRTISFLDLLLGKLPLKQKQTNNFPITKTGFHKIEGQVQKSDTGMDYGLIENDT
jgi:hypothetical protein